MSSTLNLVRGQTVPNLVVAKVGAGGKISLYNNSGTVHLIADVVGWISTGVLASVEKPATTEVVDAQQVAAISPDSDAVTVTGTAPAVGEVLFVPPSADTGAGILGKVVAAQPGGAGKTVVRTEPVSLQEAFPSGSVTGSADTRALAAGAPRSAAKSLAGRVLADEDGQLRIKASASNTPCAGHLLQVDVTLDVSARVTFDVSWGFGKLKRLRVAFEIEVEGGVTITAPANVKCSFGIGPSIPLGTVWGFVPSLQPTLKVELAAGVTDTASVSGKITVGAEYVDGQGIHWIHDGGVTGSFAPPTVAAVGKLRVAFGPKASLKFARAAGPAFFGGLFAETTLTPKENPWWSTDLGVTAEGSFDVDLWFTQVSYTLATFDVLRFRLSRAEGGWPGPTVTGGELADGTVGEPYDVPLAVAGGSAPLTLRIAKGALPPGLALNGTRITGTPTGAGRYWAYVEVKDSADLTSGAAVQILIRTPDSGGGGGTPPANPTPLWQQQLPADAANAAMLTHADAAVTLGRCYAYGETSPVLTTYDADGAPRGTLAGDTDHWPQTCLDDELGAGSDGTLYFPSRDFDLQTGESWSVAAYRPGAGIRWRSPALPSCVSRSEHTFQVGATGDLYLLTEPCDGRRHLLGIRAANGGLFLDRTIPDGSYRLDPYRDGLVLAALIQPDPPGSAPNYQAISYYGYDGTLRRTVDLPTETAGLLGTPTDLNGNTHFVRYGTPPAGTSCTGATSWAKTLVRVGPNGDVRQTALGVCRAFFAYAHPDGLLVHGSYADNTDSMTKLDSEGRKIWEYRSDRRIVPDFTIVGTDGNIAIHEIKFFPDVVRERLLVLDGRSGDVIWSWVDAGTAESDDAINYWRIADDRLYLVSTHCDGPACSPPVLSAYRAPIAIDHPRGDLLNP